MSDTEKIILDTLAKRIFAFMRKLGVLVLCATVVLLVFSPVFQIMLSSQVEAVEANVFSLRDMFTIVQLGISSFIVFSMLGILGILIRRFLLGIKSVEAD
jgi:hypothetical protein